MKEAKELDTGSYCARMLALRTDFQDVTAGVYRQVLKSVFSALFNRNGVVSGGMLTAKGDDVITQNIYDGRFHHVQDKRRGGQEMKNSAFVGG